MLHLFNNDAVAFTLSTVTTLFFVVDPPAAAPIFLSMTARDSAEHKRRTAMRASVATFVTLAVFAARGALAPAHLAGGGSRRRGQGRRVAVPARHPDAGRPRRDLDRDGAGVAR